MLLKENLLLSNCDSTRDLNFEELLKRFLTGLTFANGVIVTPNMLIDNNHIFKVLDRSNVSKYLKEDGQGKLIIRGINFDSSMCLIEYFKQLPDNYIISSLERKPRKADLTVSEQDIILRKIDSIQALIISLRPIVEKAEISNNSLTQKIIPIIQSSNSEYFKSDSIKQEFLEKSQILNSRSQWYLLTEQYFNSINCDISSIQFKNEVIDPAYNSLFANSGEGFLQDNIRYIDKVPRVFLEASVHVKSLKKEIQYIEYAMKLYEIVTTFGTTEIMKFLTDEAVGYIEDKLIEKGEEHFTRKNWFGMYPIMQKKIGLEIK
ncbi:hypothetical protein [Psychrobacter sp. DAB_AL62B]|uniref:hypothetical protein n=1 Tax=Psychrobacter sp. DAB_AL62B TaxID=1028420 RepID=UPI002380D536|nr:hypothetical protein [Psychrobacter sp. DAB_AL62B]MDE4455837.1 hypothetical protein [Psychrobacter sp. DAB_AL62B]